MFQKKERSVAYSLPRLLRRPVVTGASSRDFESCTTDIYNINQVVGAYSKQPVVNEQARAWVTQARQLAYEIDCWQDLSELEKLISGAAAASSSSPSFCCSFLERFRARKDMAHKLRDLKARFEELEKGRPRSIIDAPTRPRPIDDPRPTTLPHVNTECLVGLDAAIDEVSRMVTDVDDKAEHKIVSITGMAGSGKTTLAATVYQRLGQLSGFKCRAFISVGQQPGLRTILKELLSQLIGNEYNVNEEIGQSMIRDLLQYERYFIVLDDLWSWEDWKKIEDCFPNNNLGSTIITTTRNDQLASECSSGSRDCVHKMGLLNEADSKQLLLKQAVATGHTCPPYWDDVSDQIIRRCGGLPLALVSVAAMLAHEPSRDEWERLGSNLLSSSHMDGLKKTLNLSYTDLPQPLKSCVLYLSIFPENYMVEVKRLARLWTAEGFVPTGHLTTGKELEKVYLGDLITRNMVQWLHTKNDHGSGSSWYCRLHPVIHDFIVCKSKEENFVTVVDTQHRHAQTTQSIFRLSIHSSDEQNHEALVQPVTSMNSYHFCSVTVFGQASATPCLTYLPLSLRVLDIEGCNGLVCLDGLLNLQLLRYLSLRGTDVSELPSRIGVLRFLEVLDVGFTKVKELPSSIGALRVLQYLSLRGTDVRELPATIGKLRCLQALDVKSTEVRTTVPATICHCLGLKKLVTVDLSDQLPCFVESLGQLKYLRVVALTWSFHQCSDEAYRKALLASISSWMNLESLTIHCGLGCSMEFLGSLSDLPKKLQKFKMTAGRFASVPQWISELNNLCFVQITVCKQETDQLKILGDLPELRRLTLGLDFITETSMEIESGWFPKLERFSLDCPRPWLSFSAGSMQRLTILDLKLCGCPVRQDSVPSGIGKLQSIKEVSLCYNRLEEGSPNIIMILEAMRQAVIEHPNKIDLFINGTPQHYNAEVAEQEASSSAGTGIGTDAGITVDIQRTDEEVVNPTVDIQSTTEIEEIESED